MLQFSLLILALLLCSCDGEEQTDKSSAGSACEVGREVKKTQEQLQMAAPVRQGAQTFRETASAPDAAALARADKILAYHNHVQSIVQKGSQADTLMAGTQIYLSTWRLPRATKGGRHTGLIPPKGLFNDAEASDITSALRDMDKALADMLVHYSSLEKYVADTSIHDDGKRGRELAQKIGLAHAQYVKARKSWLGIVEKSAQKAEGTLLYNHPLKRQILAAGEIFAQFREVGSLLASGDPPVELLQVCEANLKDILASAGKPPFTAKPALERRYRDFLKQVQTYVEILERGIKEGFHSIQKRELNAATEASRRVYNKFAASVNAS